MRKSASFATKASAEDEYDSDFFLNKDYDEEAAAADEENASNALIIDKILGRKFYPNAEGEVVPWFLIKWRGRSYLHCSWEKQSDIEIVDPNCKNKLKRFFLLGLPPHLLGSAPSDVVATEDSAGKVVPEEEAEIEYFHPDLVDVHRIIACESAKNAHASANSEEAIRESAGSLEDPTDEDDIMYLVKWKGLPYDDCSWERFIDIKFATKEIWQFWQLQKPPRDISGGKLNPVIHDYKKFNTSPVFGEVSDDDSSSAGSSSSVAPPARLRLRDYQLEGLNWLLWNWWHKRSCILADEMGLGKTIQTIAFLHQLRYLNVTRIPGPFLIIAPLSLVEQWLSEINTWAPTMNVILLHGNQRAREIIVQHEFYYQDPYITKGEATNLKKAKFYKFNVLLTTYETAVKEIVTLSKVSWRVTIYDEAHKLKNSSSRNFSTLSSIKTDHMVLLTGTPLQNKTEELWALLHFAEPHRFHDQEDFLRKFGDLKDASQVASLHDLLKPYLLRRIKEDVERSLPPKEETIVEVALTTIQKRFYRAIYEKNTASLFKGVKTSNQPSLMNVMMELRKCCNHPFLVRGVEERIIEELTPDEISDPLGAGKRMIQSCGKLVLLDKLLPRLQSQGHKVLIFSQMVRVLNILEDFLRFKGYTYERLDGSTRAGDRKEAVERFCKPALNRFIMLLSTKAGGLGLNLTAADTVIIYDSDWNPQNDLQAQARAHRIGQTKAVMVYRLLTRKTYEMEMFHHASMKLGLDRAVLAHARNQQGDSKSSDTSLSAKEIDVLLKKGAYDVFREDDTEQNEFVEADIESILQRRTVKINYNETTKANSTLGTFSKASFVSADEKEDVDINDPDFWRKAIGLTSGGILQEKEEDLPQQRVRKHILTEQLYDSDDLDDLLKPINQSRAEKAARAEAAEKKRVQKEGQKEAALRDRLDRDEARRAKAIEEARIKSDPRFWGAHGRDRLLRSLTSFGYYRWEKIKEETSKPSMNNDDLEAYAQDYIVQCGLSLLDTEILKNDPQCLTDAVESAKVILDAVENGQATFNIPDVLRDFKFVQKLKSGLAKKSLKQLDLLAKLVAMIKDALILLMAEKGLALENPNEDIDRIFSSFPVNEIAPFIYLSETRQPWARTCPWWDSECDRYLLIGVFKHGFGQYTDIKKDPDLIFGRKIRSHLEAKGITKGPMFDLEKAMDVCLAMIPEGHSLHQQQHQQQQEAQFNNDDVQDEGDDDMDGPPTKRGPGAVPHSVTLNGDDMPDPRHLNKLFAYLVNEVSSEASINRPTEVSSSSMTKKGTSSAVEKGPGNKKEKKPKGEKGPSKRGIKSNLPDPTTLELRSIDMSKFAHPNQGEVASLELSLIESLRENLDLEAITSVFRAQVQGLKKCEQILGSSMVSRSSVEARLSKPQARVLSDYSDHMDVDDLVHLSSMGLNEDEAVKLSAVFILFGGPTVEYVQPELNAVMRECMGFMSSNSEETGSTSCSHYNWDNLVAYSKMSLRPEVIEKFYSTVWIPFCQQIFRKQALSTQLHKFLVPNPLISFSEHHVAAKGLCQLFTCRQQVLRTISYVLNTQAKELIDHLRGTSGRNVDNMPIWWCPWIHDIGLLLGMLRHGYLMLDRIFADPELPFSPRHVETLVRKVFLEGNAAMPAMARFDLNSAAEAEQFVKFTSSQYPDAKDVELRVLKILEEMTKALPADHYASLVISSQALRNLTSHAVIQEPADGDKSSALTEVNGSSSSSSKAGNKSSSDNARGKTYMYKTPAVSLKNFIQSSRKRRRTYLATYHGDLIGQPSAGEEA